MERQIFIFHGVGGYPGENWFPWLKKELERLGCKVHVPQFPTPENQNLESWLKVLDGYNSHLDESCILVGHSLGAPFLLNVLEKHHAHAAFLVASFTGVAGNDFDDGMRTFTQRKFNWGAIRKNCSKFYVLHSDNDPYIKLDKGNEVAKNLGVELTLVKGAGHFNTNSGYTKFDLLFEMIKKEL